MMLDAKDLFEHLSRGNKETYLKLAGRDDFSAIASGVWTSDDFVTLKKAMEEAGLPAEWHANSAAIRAVVKLIADWIITQKDT